MTARERFWRFVAFEELDQLPYWADWLGPYRTWRKQGLPIESEPGDVKLWFIDLFGFEGMYSAFWGHPRVPVQIGLCPGFAGELLEETARYRVVRAGNGSVVRQFRDADGSLISTQWLEYPVKNRSDWQRLREEQLDPHAPGRYPSETDWVRMTREWKERDYVLSVDGGSFYGFLRDWIGLENLSLMLYDDPHLVRDMMEYLADFYIEVLHRAVEEVEIDFAMFWEDMCYKTGPLLSPGMFREFLLPAYTRVTSFLEEHGVLLSWVDCDGNIEELVPLWVEGGVRGFYPLEVAAGMDAVKLRKEYGTEILMWGNVDKRALSRGKGAIDSEMRRLEPAVRAGGFLPLVDHGVPDDVPYENYLYYLEQRKKLTGWGG